MVPVPLLFPMFITGTKITDQEAELWRLHALAVIKIANEFAPRKDMKGAQKVLELLLDQSEKILTLLEERKMRDWMKYDFEPDPKDVVTVILPGEPMMCYRDRTYCSAKCIRLSCCRLVTLTVEEDARRLNLPLALSDFRDTCKDYIPAEPKGTDHDATIE